MKLDRFPYLFVILTLLALSFIGYGIIRMRGANNGNPEPAAVVQVEASPPAATADLSPTPAVDAGVRSVATLPTSAPAVVDTPTAVPSRAAAPTVTMPAATSTIAPTRVVPTAAPRPSSTPRPTATPLPPTATRIPPTATPIPLPTSTPAPTVPAATATRSGVETASVTAVIDGDTIEVNLNGQIWRVRYIGMNTPESNEVCGSEATAANAALVGGRTVTMVRDVSETDRYGRLLRYVYVDDVFVNGDLVAGGWADPIDYPPDTAMSGLLHSLAPAGVGRGCDLVAAPLPTVEVRGPEATAPAQGGNCHPSYPTVCIPPPPPDLDCGDIPHRRFQVIGDDPHRFDGNHDGVGCEG